MSPGHSEVAYNDSLCKFNFSYSKRVSRRFVQNRKYPKALCFQKGSGTYRSLDIIPTRCRNLYLEQFCLDDIVPTILIILIARIIIAIRWMLIKILSGVISATTIAENVFVLVYILFQAVVNHVSIFLSGQPPLQLCR